MMPFWLIYFSHLPFSLRLIFFFSLLFNRDLYLNSLSGSLPTEFGQLGVLETLYVHFLLIDNSLEFIYAPLTLFLHVISYGTPSLSFLISSDVFFLSLLFNRILEDNSLTGTLPTELGKLEEVIYLYAHFLLIDNSLEFTYAPSPYLISSCYLIWCNPSISFLISLTFFFLFFSLLFNRELQVNLITGTLPTELGQLKEVRSLYAHFLLFDNSLEFTYAPSPYLISSFFLLLMILFFFSFFFFFSNLGDNFLNGTIPTEIGQLTSPLGTMYFVFHFTFFFLFNSQKTLNQETSAITIFLGPFPQNSAS